MSLLRGARWRRTVRLLPVFLLAPALLAAQGSSDARLSGRLDRATRDQVDSLVRVARDRGLPIEPLVQKALEGASKGADGPRIVAAVRSLAGAMTQARSALGSSANDAEIVAGALSLRSGATPDMLHDLASISGRRALDVPLGVLTDLIARGQPVSTAYGSVERLLRLGATDAELLNLRDHLPMPGEPVPSTPPLPGRTPGAPAPAAPRVP